MIFLEDLKNIIDFSLRQKFAFSRTDFTIKNEPKNLLFFCDDQKQREFELFKTYNLDFVKNSTTKQNYLENLYTLDLLDKYLQVENLEHLRVLDIGCKNWFYAKGEYSFFKKYCNKLDFNGIELDANRLYSNFYSRGETAKANIKGLDNANYIAGDFLEHNEKYDYIVWFLPFVFEEPLTKWGLPLKYFKPKEMLEHAYKSLNTNGKIFIINQGEEEFDAQKKLCDELKIQYKQIGIVKSEFFDYKFDRFLTLVLKTEPNN